MTGNTSDGTMELYPKVGLEPAHGEIFIVGALLSTKAADAVLSYRSKLETVLDSQPAEPIGFRVAFSHLISTSLDPLIDLFVWLDTEVESRKLSLSVVWEKSEDDNSVEWLGKVIQEKVKTIPFDIIDDSGD